MAGGRPTKYSDAMLEAAQDYVDGGYTTVPTVAGLSLALNVTKSTVYKWGEEEGKEEFSDTLAKLQAVQENLLVSGGLSTEFSGTITKLMLSNHGYRETSATELSGKDGGPIEGITFTIKKPK